jgi:hypothetical protein
MITAMFNMKTKKKKADSWEEKIESLEHSVYIEGVKVLQKQERIGYFFTLIVSLALIMILFVILWMV